MDYQLSRLDHGLRVLTVTMPQRESVAVAIWVATGSRFESPRLMGISHFLEHMVFKGTKTRSGKEIRRSIEGVGGVLNAFTGEESTCYFAKLLSKHLSVGLEVLSDIVKNATLEQGEVKKERDVILEEIKMYMDLPSHHIQDVMGEMLWPDQPLGRPISGTLESVARLAREDLAEYRNQYYQNQNILVSVSGPVTHQSILDQVPGRFLDPGGNSRISFKKAVSHQKHPRCKFIEKAIEQTHFVIGFHSFSRFHPDRYKLGLLNVILGANMSSRLFEEVREKRGLAYEIRTGSSFYRDTGSFTISAGVEDRKAKMAVDVILRELKKISKSGVNGSELRRAKDYFLSQFYMALEDSLDHLLWAGERVLDMNELPNHKKIRRGIESVKKEEIQEVARHIFRSETMNLALIGPISNSVQAKIQGDFFLP